MSLHVVEKASKFQADRSRGVVVIESDCEGPPFTDAFHELDSQDARTKAQGYATGLGMASARINGNVEGPYPVNAEGLSLEEVKDAQGHALPASHERMKPKRYRVDIPVCVPLR